MDNLEDTYLLAFFFGIAIYMLFFSKIIINVSVRIISFIKKIISYILKIISYPLNILRKIIYSIIIRPIKQISTKIKDFSKKMLKNNNKHDKILQNKEGI